MAETTSHEVSRKDFRYTIVFDEFFPHTVYQTGQGLGVLGFGSLTCG
jgi:hypothetical protein